MNVINTMSIIGACFAILAALGGGIGTAIAAKSAMISSIEQPAVSSKIQSVFIMGAGLCGATAIYGFVIAMIIIFIK